MLIFRIDSCNAAIRAASAGGLNRDATLTAPICDSTHKPLIR